MGLGKILFVLLVAAVVFGFTAGSAQATHYVRPSGDGGLCGTQDPTSTNCVDGSGSTLECGENGLACPEGFYNLYEVGVTAGATVDFTFSSDPGSTLQIVACGYNSSSAPGIYPSGSDTSLNLPCTSFGVGVDPTTTSFINDLTGTSSCATDTVCYHFSATDTGLPFTWVFGEISNPKGPTVLSINETFPSTGGGGGTVPTPEPASMTLLAAGVAGLGMLRRKQAA